jgi:hypothetical protein
MRSSVLSAPYEVDRVLGTNSATVYLARPEQMARCRGIAGPVPPMEAHVSQKRNAAPNQLRRGFVIGLALLASASAEARGSSSPEEPRFRGLSIQLHAVMTSTWTTRTELVDSPPPGEPPEPVTYSTYREKAAGGPGLEAAYCFGHGLTPYVSSDLNIQTIHGQWGGVDDYLTLSAGLRIRHPLSRRVALYGQAALTYLRLSSPKYPQSFVGVGAEYFIGETLALSGTLELPVYGDDALEDPPQRILVGIRWYVGHREGPSLGDNRSISFPR